MYPRFQKSDKIGEFAWISKLIGLHRVVLVYISRTDNLGQNTLIDQSVLLFGLLSIRIWISEDPLYLMSTIWHRDERLKISQILIFLRKLPTVSGCITLLYS